jgi:hypothetical protein
MLLAALVHLLAAVMRTASERTVEIPPIGVPRMCQEANRAMTAVDRAACQTGMIAQDPIQRDLILTNKRTGTIVLMPIRAKCKEFPGGYDKNAKFSVKMLIVLGTPLSYELDAHASRCRARFFLCISEKRLLLGSHDGSIRQRPSRLPHLRNLRCPAKPCKLLLGKQNQQLRSRKTLFLFPVVGPLS